MESKKEVCLSDFNLKCDQCGNSNPKHQKIELGFDHQEGEVFIAFYCHLCSNSEAETLSVEVRNGNDEG